MNIVQIIKVFLLSTGTLVSCNDLTSPKKQVLTQITYNADSTTVKFKGIITGVKNDCWSDGNCSIEVNSKWRIVIQQGLSLKNFTPRQVGESTGIRFTEDNQSMGKKVAVYAKIKDDNLLTLEGNKTYYVKVLETKNLEK